MEPCSNESLRENSSEFFKVFLPSSSSRHMCLPPAFVKHFKGTIPKEAVLKDQTGRSWRVAMEELEKGLFFKNGWQAFVDYHFLDYGDFLIFRYDGKSSFNVAIFGKNGCKKEVIDVDSFIPLVKLEPEVDQTCGKSTHSCKQKHEEVGDRGRSKLEENYGRYKRCKREREEVGSIQKPEGTKSRRIATTNLGNREPMSGEYVEPGSPHFTSTITKWSKFGVNVSKRVMNAFKIRMRGPNVVLRDQKGKRWPVKLCVGKDGRTTLTSGWDNFLKNNNLRIEDQCVFEFVLSSGNRCKQLNVQVLQGHANSQKQSNSDQKQDT